jgi:methyl-accepting chemotaxis protein
MQTSITLFELGLIILFLTLLVVGIYAVLTLRNINAATREINGILRRHRGELEELGRSVPHIVEASAHAVDVMREVKLRVSEAGRAIETISRDTTNTVLRVNETADHVASYVMVFGEIVKAVLELFTKGKRS